MPGNGAYATRPSIQLASFDLRFRNVIDNEFLFRKLLHEFIRDVQMAGINQNVIRETKSRKHADSAQKLFPHQKAIVGFRLNDVTKAAQLPGLGKVRESLFNCIFEQVHPAYDSGDFVMVFGKIEQKAGFLF